MVVHFLTDRATKKKMDEEWLVGFEANPPQVWPKIEDSVTKFVGFFGDMKDGDVVEIDIVPGAGASVAVNGDPMGVIEGDDFGSALLAVWLGDHPPSDDLKVGLLGR
ncbi:MAG TPA: chalcone isomerase family protein [Methylomirabilota bacterium]|nr:chalcone isomerase family protein [Methylomirabilota bacterium]